MEIINAGMRKGIKSMCVVSQTLQFVALMPKPQDFVTRIVGDVVYLSSQIQKLSDDMNRLLDSYADIPSNYLMTQMNSITGSLTGITNRLDTFTQNAINKTVGIGETTIDMISTLTGETIESAGVLSGAISNLGMAVAETSSDVLGKFEIANDIHDSAEVVLEWTGSEFKTISSNVTDKLKSVTKKLTDIKTQGMTTVGDTASKVNDTINNANKWVETLISELREKMQQLSNLVDTNFKDVTGLSSVSKGATTISEELKQYGENTKVNQAIANVSGSLASVINNFSIGKVVSAFTGVLVQSVIVRTGLDQLPPIDFESMLYKIRNDLTMSSEDMYNQYSEMVDNTYAELENMPPEGRNYSQENYKEFLKEYDEELKKQREDIRHFMKRQDLDKRVLDTQSKREMRSAIKEMQKFRKKIKNAKQADTLKDIIGRELDRFKKEAEYRCNSIKSDWQSMMNQYKASIEEIKQFFTNGGSCDMFIDDCCDAINQDFNDIKEICKNLTTQLVASTVKIAMPSDIGSVVPNPAYKIADFWMDIKTIFKFIKDLIEKIIDIINNINKISRIMLNGLNSLGDIIKQLMELFGLKWLMDLIQSIIEAFGDNIKSSRERLINTLSPVHFRDTEEFEHTIDVLDEYLENGKTSKEGNSSLSSTLELLESYDDKKLKDLIGGINNVLKFTTVGDKQSEKIEELIDELDDRGDIIIAYKSPIIKEVGESSNVSDMINGEPMDNDIKFIGWHFFHPNLNHTGNIYYTSGIIGRILKKIKSKIIKKASKNGHKIKGGVAQLHKKKVGTSITKIDEAYTAFYWYTYYTEDLEKDCFDRTTVDNTKIIDNVVRTENGSVVEVTDGDGNKRKVFVADNYVRQGDYVTVDGVKYRVN